MSLNNKSFLLVFCLLLYTCVLAQDSLSSPSSIRDTILDSFKKDTKSLFKVWHFVFNKSYDYNTLEGLNKYKIFKAKLKKIEEHNKGNSSYKKGLNHLSDMTYEEVKKYYNLEPINIKRVSRSLRALNSFNLDDYNDDEEVVKAKEEAAKAKEEAPQGIFPVDHRGIMRPVRDQGECGSCWSFTTMAVLEGFYQKQVGRLNDWFSTQFSVDCDYKNHGCKGGWFHSFDFYQTNSPILESEYPYLGVKSYCKKDRKSVNKKVVRVNVFDVDSPNNGTIETFYRYLAQGPVAIAVDANDNFTDYKSGVYDSYCDSEVNHAVTLVGFSAGSRGVPAHYIIRNSWGITWGENGHIRVAKHTNNSACNIEKFGYQGLFA